MNLKSSRKPLLAGLFALLLLGCAGTSFGAIRFDVFASPTEVIDTGRSEVLGSINMIVRGSDALSGTSQGGAVQIGIIYNDGPLQIDNLDGIKVFFTSGFQPAFTEKVTVPASGKVGIVSVSNINLGGKIVGQITLNLAPGARPAEGEWIHVEGVRGRIDVTGSLPGTNFKAQLQSINDPSANQFYPETVRVATVFDGMEVKIVPESYLLCFAIPARPTTTNYIKITESFNRAFVANTSPYTPSDRTDSGGAGQVPVVYTTTPAGVNAGTAAAESAAGYLGRPINATQFYVYLDLPSFVATANWPADVYEGSLNAAVTVGSLHLITSKTVAGDYAWAQYEYRSTNQTGWSDTKSESYYVNPTFTLSSITQVGDVLAYVTLSPDVDAQSGSSIIQPISNASSAGIPRFQQMFESDAAYNNGFVDDEMKIYASFIRCNCYLLFTYVTSENGYDTGIAVANTTGDTEVFTTAFEAADQVGKITFFYYSATDGYVGKYSTSEVGTGKSYIQLVSKQLPTGVTKFSGYVIAKAEFQFCHALAFVADTAWSNFSHGYPANIIPDPAIKGTALTHFRSAADAADFANAVLSGEALNN